MIKKYNNDVDNYFQERYTGMEHMRRMFQDYTAATPLPKRIILLHGVGGIGKSTLLRMFRLYCHSVSIPVGLAAGGEAISLIDVLSNWTDDLKSQGITLSNFTKTVKHYRSIQAKIEDQAHKKRDAVNKTAQRIVEATGILSPFTSALRDMPADALSDWLLGFLSKPDVDLLLRPNQKISTDFLKDINKAAEKKRLVLLLDTFEQMSALEDWLGEIAQNIYPNVLLVIAGRRLPNWHRVWPGWLVNAWVEELKPLTDDTMRELIHRYYASTHSGKPDPAQVESIIQYAHGLPLVATIAVQLWTQYGVEDFQVIKPQVLADLVDRLVENVPRKLIPAIEAAAVVRWFDKPIIRAVLKQEDIQVIYDELCRFPFVRARSEGLALQESVRGIINESLHVQDPKRYTELHKRAAVYFQKQLEEVTGKDAELLRLERLYHTICADEGLGIELFQQMVEELVAYKLTNQLEVLMNDVRSYYFGIPSELIADYKDPQELLSYLFELRNKGEKLFKEIKLLMVGQGSVGKTSLVRRLIWDEFEPRESKTDGIAIEHWQLNTQSAITNQNYQIRLNVWDFGGQEIMHATHQFFLTKRSLYLLVVDSRNTQEENRIEYWLKIIQSVGGESPVLIIGNKIDQHPLDIDRTGLQKKYTNIVGVLETSASTGAGIEELRNAIIQQVANLKHIRDLLPATWFTVKAKLEELGRKYNFITYDKYLELCAENDISDDTSQRALIGFLHDLGVVLHFQDDPRLESLGILNPLWVTNGVYKILNSPVLFQNKGVLERAMLDEILNIPEYPREKRLFIVDTMRKFELCYDIEPDKLFLIPDLLHKDEPALDFNGVPAFEYLFSVLPSSVITRFIVRMNHHILENWVWRSGVLLEIGENRALVRADEEDRKIRIAIDGPEHTRRDTLAAIRYQLDEIHASIKGLNPQKRVPIPGAPQAEPLEYEYLLMLEQEGEETYIAKDGKRLVRVNVRQLLSGIESESQRKESQARTTNIYFSGNVDGSTIITGDENAVK